VTHTVDPEFSKRAVSVRLIRPTLDQLPNYVAALERGWSPDNVRGAAAAAEQLRAIALDPSKFVAGLHDPECKGAPVMLPDGSSVPRLPGYTRWIWDGDFCGAIGFRWRAAGDSGLPAHVLGHVGYAVVPWKRGNGYATQALALIVPEAKAKGLAYIELTTDPDNIASQRAILKNGGAPIEHFQKPAAFGGTDGLRFRIGL